MKKIAGFVLGLMLSNNGFALTPQEIKDLCTPAGADKGKSTSTTVSGKGEVGGLMRKVGLGAELNGTHATSEFEGGQHVSQPQQAVDNKNYRDCVLRLASKEKTTTATKSDSNKTKKVTSNPKAQPVKKTKDAPVQVKCEGDKNLCGDVINGPVTIN
jgi:hypothetical protein